MQWCHMQFVLCYSGEELARFKISKAKQKQDYNVPGGLKVHFSNNGSSSCSSCGSGGHSRTVVVVIDWRGRC